MQSVQPEGVILDQTVFYAMGGGQPGDQGELRLADASIRIVDTRKFDDSGAIIHLTESPPDPAWAGQAVHAAIDWQRRHRIMRVHTLLHVLGSIVRVGVTGGAIRDDGTGRLDFDLPDLTLDKDALNDQLADVLGQSFEVGTRWITDAELDASPELVRTMSVAPPRGAGRVRLLEIQGLDLQACGGTHVRNTSEIGPSHIRKIEKKGRHNRRVNVQLNEP